LLDRGFEQTGFCVVRGPDLIFGGDIKKFSVPDGHFSGVIGGPPCQKFSLANRNRDVAGGMELVNEFLRVVNEAAPEWALMENVPGSPHVTVPGLVTQLFTLDASHVGSEQHRLRKFHFFHKAGTPELVIGRDVPGCDPAPACMASEGRRNGRRSWSEFCRLQGLPDGFDLPGFTVQEKYRAVGNGVPFPMALALATAIRNRDRRVTPHRVCECGCGQFVTGRARLASVSCRKRMQRSRDEAAGDCAAQQLNFATA
jgi:DNA (cytosine-5)-methyltransferase 1